MVSPGGRFEGYVVDAILGHGGYATVYRAHHCAGADRVVALKILDDRYRHGPQTDRLRREFEFAQQLDHPHIVRMYERGEAWLAMELIAGGTVAKLPAVANRLTALAQIADALDYAHQRGIVHCDVKPTNILVASEFSRYGAALIDFGVAHAVVEDVGRRPHHLAASLQYSAPELLHGHAPTGATDQYALACTLVELITGAPPFAARTSMELVDAHLHRAPPRLSRRADWLPHAVDSILAKAMAKSPDSRYGSCAEFIELVTRAVR